MKNTDYFVIVVWSEEDRAYLGIVPDLSGCMADGATREEALKNASRAILDWIEVAKGLGREIPLPRDQARIEKDIARDQDSLQKRLEAAAKEAVRTTLGKIPKVTIASGGAPSKPCVNAPTVEARTR